MFLGVQCSECGALAMFDDKSTYNLYDNTDFYEIEDIDTVTEECLNKKIGFVCVICGNLEYLGYNEWYNKIRMSITKQLLRDRTAVLLSKFRSRGVDETSGVSYCGGCLGYGGDGWCLNEIIEQCELGSKKKNGL